MDGAPATSLVISGRPDDENPTSEPVHFPVHLLLGPHAGSSGVHSDADSEALKRGAAPMEWALLPRTLKSTRYRTPSDWVGGLPFRSAYTEHFAYSFAL